MKQPVVRTAALALVACVASAFTRASAPPQSLGAPAGTYVIERGPVADGDSSVLELVGGPEGAWGWWVRAGDHPRVAVHHARLAGDELTLTAAMGAGPATLRLRMGPGYVFTGEWARGQERIPFRGVWRAGVISPELRELASVEPFAAGAVSTPDSGESFGTLSADGRELFFTTHPPNWSPHRIMVSRLEGARWSRPTPLPFSGTYNDREPKLSPDGKRLFFSSNRPTGAAPGDTARRRDLDLWVAERGADGRWGEPRHLDAPVNTDAQEFCPVVTANGTLYFVSTRAGGITTPGSRTHNVWRARPLGAGGTRYAAPENLGPAINAGWETNVYVSPDERVMLVSRDGAPDSFGGDDLYASRFQNGAWAPMRHLGRPINSPEYEYGPFISADGRWLHFTSHRRGTADLYRVDARLLDAAAAPAPPPAPATPQSPPQSPPQPQPRTQSSEAAAVRRAVLDYVEGFYEGDTAKLARSVRRDVFKYGFWRPRDSTTYQGEQMPWSEFVTYAVGVKTRNRQAPPTAPKQVVLFEVQNQTASAKVTAFWGTDYLLLGKYGGKWMISSVMWQSPPK